MPTFVVTMEQTVNYEFTVEAENADAAYGQVRERVDEDPNWEAGTTNWVAGDEITSVREQATTTWTCWRDAAHEVRPHQYYGWPQCTRCSAAPPYHERADYLPPGFSLGIYVPAKRGGTVADGSAIVGHVTEDGQFHVAYEGWVYGAAQYEGLGVRGRWEAGLHHAANRLVTRYPSRATQVVDARWVHEVGRYEVATSVVTITDEPALSRWLEEDES